MTSSIFSSAIVGVDAVPIRVEVDLSYGLPGFHIVGLPENSVKEARERVRSALKNSGFDLYPHRITVNLAPADLRKEGTGYDLPLALALLSAQGELPKEVTEKIIAVGELGLNGEVRGVAGILPVALMAKNWEGYTLMIPRENLPEAQVVEGISLLPVETLAEGVKILKKEIPPPTIPPPRVGGEEDSPEIDFAEVKGQEHVKRAIEVACAGGHNLLMIGPPGAGKTMLAMRIPTILPEMEFSESLETTKIYSVSGLLPAGVSLLRQRPFRHPHHSISDAGLVGGGAIPKPGEVSLAHNGVLFLDELPEFKKNVLELLRQPMEDGMVVISRAAMRVVYPARFMLVASMNPCPCGYFGDPIKPCVCTPQAILKYRSRISGPLLDRIDVHIEVPPIQYREFREKGKGEGSKEIRERVKRARKIQEERFSRRKKIHTNAQMSARDIERYCPLDPEGHKLLETAVHRLGMSARGISRILKVARTIADLEGSPNIRTPHLAEAIQYRSLDRFHTFIKNF